MLLARFFKVHPGYLVDDPEGFQNELVSELWAAEDKLDLWLIEGAERFRRDPEVSRTLLRLAQHEDTRKCLTLLGALLESPDLVDRLLQAHAVMHETQENAKRPLLLLVAARRAERQIRLAATRDERRRERDARTRARARQ